MIKMRKCIPIDKLAQTLKISNEAAEDLIYEIGADERVQGTIDDGICNFNQDETEVVLSLINDLIDNM